MLTQVAGFRSWLGPPAPRTRQYRKDNCGCEYEAYLPDRLVGRAFSFDGQVAADVADAEAAIARLNREAKSLVDTEALARMLLRAESVASSRDLLGDLFSFSNDESMPAVAQTAVAHSQFETIHPFIDGNGRTGRALIHLILRRRGLSPRVLPPVSLILATWARTMSAA